MILRNKCMENPWHSHQYLSLASKKRNGDWVETPVWFAQDTLRVMYCVSSKNAWKIKRINRFPEVRITPCTVRGAFTGSTQHAVAHVLTEPAQINHAYTVLLHKYRWQMRLLNIIATMVGTKKNRAFIKITIDP